MKKFAEPKNWCGKIASTALYFAADETDFSLRIVSEWLAASLERKCRFTGCEFESRAIRLEGSESLLVVNNRPAGFFYVQFLSDAVRLKLLCPYHFWATIDQNIPNVPANFVRDLYNNGPCWSIC